MKKALLALAVVLTGWIETGEDLTLGPRLQVRKDDLSPTNRFRRDEGNNLLER